MNVRKIIEERKQKWLVVKLKLEKAYCYTYWEFLDYIIARKGFGFSMKEMDLWMPITNHFSIILNGTPKSFPTRDLRQGDPLSPFLFSMVAGSLSQIMLNVELRGLFKGLQVGTDNVNVSHLQFADDTLTLMDGDRRYAHILKHLVGTALSTPEYIKMANSVGCSNKGWPTDYLGLPLGGSPWKKEFWNPVLDRCRNRLA